LSSDERPEECDLDVTLAPEAPTAGDVAGVGADEALAAGGAVVGSGSLDDPVAVETAVDSGAGGAAETAGGGAGLGRGGT
jgi:hypothetical protein